MDIGGGKITIADIDKLKKYPHIDVVTISGLKQDTFEYFIKTYGKQLKAISFFKNKFIEDLSLLGTLPQLEYIYFFANQRVTSLWDMTKNVSLTGLCIMDFSRLTSIKGVETAPALKEFRIGNEVWNTMAIDSFMPLANTKIQKLSFLGKNISDNDLSFLETLPELKVFNFATIVENILLVANDFAQDTIDKWLYLSFRQNGDMILIKAEFSRKSPLPGWSFQNWLLDESKSGGCLVDMHVHDVDVMVWLFGQPEDIQVLTSHKMADFESVYALYRYPEHMVSIIGDWGLHTSFDFRAFYGVTFEKAYVEYMDGVVTVYTNEGKEEVTLPGGDSLLREEIEFIDGVVNGKPFVTANVESVYDTMKLIFREKYGK